MSPRLWHTTARSVTILGLLVLASAALVHAQERRHGAWMDLGLGYGSASFSCDTCASTQHLGGWTLSFGAGGTLSPHLRLGADVRVWVNGLKAGEKLPGIDVVGLKLSYYRRPRGGPFALAGVGLSHYEVCKGRGDPLEPCTTGSSYYSGSGWGGTLGGGWEIARGRGALRPVLTFHHGAVRRVHSPDGATVATGWNQNLLTVELAVLVNFVR